LWEQANSQTDGMVSLNFMASINTMAQFMIDNVHQLFETPTSSFEISSLPPVCGTQPLQMRACTFVAGLLDFCELISRHRCAASVPGDQVRGSS
jgi:hypothetical protein